MNIDWFDVLYWATAAWAGWYIALQQKENDRLRKSFGEAMDLLRKMEKTNHDLVELNQHLAGELDRERRDNWWKGEPDADP
jgi:hypothetical protein